MRIATNSPILGGDKSPPKMGHFIGHSFATQVKNNNFGLKLSLLLYMVELRIETNHIFKVNAFATQVKIEVFITYVLFSKYCIEGFFTYNIIVFKFIVPLF